MGFVFAQDTAGGHVGVAVFFEIDRDPVEEVLNFARGGEPAQGGGFAGGEAEHEGRIAKRRQAAALQNGPGAAAPWPAASNGRLTGALRAFKVLFVRGRIWFRLMVRSDVCMPRMIRWPR